jgi:hypothetical protein
MMVTRRRLLLLSVSIVTLTVGWVLFVPPPRPVVRGLVNAFPTAVLTGSDADTGATRVFKRSLHLYVKSALAAYVAEHLDVGGERDVAALLRVVEGVRAIMLNQIQVPHSAKAWSSIVSGLGYCDQINGAVAHVASHRFRRAQLYALYDAARKSSPHTIGRVWSDERRDWLYFDASYDTPIMFAKKGDAAPEFVDARGRTDQSRGRPAMELYSLPGWILNEYRPSVAGQIRAMLAGRFSAAGPRGIDAPVALAGAASSLEPPELSGYDHCASSVAPRLPGQVDCDVPKAETGTRKPSGNDAPPPVSSVSAVVAVARFSEPPPAAYDQGVFERVARAYAAARMAHLLDDGPNRAAYLAIADDTTAARDARAAEFASAARVFARAQ